MAKVARHPLAFGLTYWGPLPETRDMHVMWDGPGSGLRMYVTDPTRPGAMGQPIRHPSASGTFATVREAEKAVNAFVAELT